MNIPKDLFVESKKREMADLHYRKQVCRCLKTQVSVMQKLMCDLPGSNWRYDEYLSYFESLNKVWKKIVLKETNLFDQMVTFGLTSVEIDGIMQYVESIPIDEYAVYDTYGITPGKTEDNNRKISLILDGVYT